MLCVHFYEFPVGKTKLKGYISEKCLRNSFTREQHEHTY